MINSRFFYFYKQLFLRAEPHFDANSFPFKEKRVGMFHNAYIIFGATEGVLRTCTEAIWIHDTPRVPLKFCLYTILIQPLSTIYQSNY